MLTAVWSCVVQPARALSAVAVVAVVALIVTTLMIPPGRCSGHRPGPGVTCVCMQTVAAATQLGPCVPVTGHVSPSDTCHTVD